MKKPNFFIIGAPKCGTSSLRSWLSQHPDIYFSPIKEPHFFNRDGMYYIDTIEEYETLFSKAGENHIAVGEASTNYLYSHQAVPEILKYNSEARLIACVRNPIQMAPSLHSQIVWNGFEIIKDFEKAWRLQEVRNQGKNIPRNIRKYPYKLQYGAYCKLGEQINRLYTQVNRDRVLVLVLDDLARDPQKEYKKILKFLGIPEESFEPQFIAYNQRKAVRSVLFSHVMLYLKRIYKSLGFKYSFNIYSQIQRSINKAEPKILDLSPEFKNELKAYFETDINLLEHLLNRDFSSWLS